LKVTQLQAKKAQKADIELFKVVLPLVMRFVPLNQIAYSAQVSVPWNIGVCQYRYYIILRYPLSYMVSLEYYFRDYMDMRDAAPWNVYRPHLGMVESMVLFRHVLFSSGDKSVIGSDIHSGETLGRVTRDSGKIPVLMVCCSL
jgi:hypothetical protein